MYILSYRPLYPKIIRMFLLELLKSKNQLNLTPVNFLCVKVVKSNFC